MRRVLLRKREWIRYLDWSGELLDQRGWPVHPELQERLTAAGFDRHRPVTWDLVPYSTIRFRQFTGK